MKKLKLTKFGYFVVSLLFTIGLLFGGCECDDFKQFVLSKVISVIFIMIAGLMMKKGGNIDEIY